MPDPVVGITNGVPTSGTGTITTLGQTLTDGANISIGATTDAAVSAGAAGSLLAKLRAISRDLVANIVLAAGTNIIGKVGIDPAANLIVSAPTYRAAVLSQAPVNCNSSGDNILVTRSVGTIKVYGILLIADSGVVMTFKNGASAVSGPMNAGSIYLEKQSDPYFTTTGTNNFILNLGTGVQVSGVIYYLDS